VIELLRQNLGAVSMRNRVKIRIPIKRINQMINRQVPVIVVAAKAITHQIVSQGLTLRVIL